MSASAKTLLLGVVGALAVLLPAAAQVGAPAPATVGESAARRLGRAEPWSATPVLPFPTSSVGRAESLAARREGRAYAGAPPTLPHSADFGEPQKTCLDCHGAGMRMGQRVAHPMSHAPFAQCLQCHVERESRWNELAPGPRRALAPSDFAGLAPPGPEPRFAPGAPPVVPHSLAMRGRCLSCHGEFGYEGLRTRHPERSQCVQCHAAREAGRW